MQVDGSLIQEEEQTVFDNIRLLSYNIFIRMTLLHCPFSIVTLGPPAPKFTHNVANDFKDQRLECFISNYLEKYDVICLQEMFGAFSSRRRKLVKEARKRGFHWKVSSPQSRSSMCLVDGGCLILSRVRVAAESSMVFSTGLMSDRLAAKGVLYAKLNPKPNVYVHLFVTHLQAVYADSPSSMGVCQSVQRKQYSELVEFITSTVAANETTSDMLVAERLSHKKNEKKGGMAASAPEQDTMSFLSHRCRRWPVLLAGDFNCNSRPTPGDIVTRVTPQYTDLTSELSKLGPFSDVLYDNLGDHPVTYAAAVFSLDGTFSPHETALTHPADYQDDGEWVNQSLDYIFLFPPTHEDVKLVAASSASSLVGDEGSTPASPDSRALNRALLKPQQVSVKHLEYQSAGQAPGGSLQYLSDHMALEALLHVSSETA